MTWRLATLGLRKGRVSSLHDRPECCLDFAAETRCPCNVKDRNNADRRSQPIRWHNFCPLALAPG